MNIQDSVWKNLLIERMQAIGRTLSCIDSVLAVLATGSAGLHPQLMDRFSDLDLLVVTAEESTVLVEDTTWLGGVHEVLHVFRYNDDCVKVFFADGVYCELSVIGQSKLPSLVYSGSTVVWARSGFNDTWCKPNVPAPASETSLSWLLEELGSVLYIGACKLGHGEHLAALGYIEGTARELATKIVRAAVAPCMGVPEDPFSKDRRFERAYPTIAPTLLQCFHGSDDIARSINDLIEFIASLSPGIPASVRCQIVSCLA